MGKRRQAGARPGFEFAIPKLTMVAGVDLSAGLQAVYDQYAVTMIGEDTWPALVLDIRHRLGEVNENAEVISRPMSYRKFQELLRGIFMQLGATADAAVKLPYNSLRRVAPTAALFFNLSSEQAQAISNWQEVPEAAKSKDVPAALQRSTFPMSRHYAGMKTMESARIKLCLFLMVFDCIKRTIKRRQSEGKGAFAKNAEGLVPFGSITWQDMVPQKRPSSEYQELIQAKQTLVDPGASMKQWTSAAVLRECRPQLGRSERANQSKRQRLEPLDTLLMDTTQQRPK